MRRCDYNHGTWKCHSFDMGKFLHIHWHTGKHDATPPYYPNIRLRGVWIWKWKLPLKYYEC